LRFLISTGSRTTFVVSFIHNTFTKSQDLLNATSWDFKMDVPLAGAFVAKGAHICLGKPSCGAMSAEINERAYTQFWNNSAIWLKGDVIFLLLPLPA
jgi:hypothetical protein